MQQADILNAQEQQYVTRRVVNAQNAPTCPELVSIHELHPEVLEPELL